MKIISGGVCAATGFTANGVHCGIRKNRTKKDYPQGNFVTAEGKILGTHKGIINYTIGQRRGLGLALPAPLYVCRKSICDNTVVLCSEGELFKKSITVQDINWIAFDKAPESFRTAVKIRYNQKETPATVFLLDEDRARVEFDEPQRAPAMGQSAVFYDGDTVVGGGIIE